MSTQGSEADPSLVELARRAVRALRRYGARRRAWSGVEPLSERFGSERGNPICRHYLEGFLREHAADIRGHCLEFEAGYYTQVYGGERVTRTDVLHVDDSNPRATIVADLTKPNTIAGDQFDCIICTHVLHVIYDLDRAVAELHRILKPGGALLVAVPHVSMRDRAWRELWRFTDEGLGQVLRGPFGEENVEVRAYGNSLTAAGAIRGLAARDFSPSELDYHDERFAVEICARAVKRG